MPRSRLSSSLSPMNRLPADRVPIVVHAKVCGPHSVVVVFDDGISKQVDLRRLLKGSIFRPLLDPAEFAKLFVDHEAGTIVWPNQADIAPETLYLLPDERGSAA